MLAVFFAIPCVAQAQNEKEGFTFRNGIYFGDSMETVMEKETLEFTENEENGETDEDGFSLMTVQTTLANIDNSYAVYHFSDNMLDRVVYNYRSDTTGERVAVTMVIVSDFTNIETALDEKYGEAIDENDEYASIDTKTLDDYEQIHGIMELMAILKGTSIDEELKISERIVHEVDGVVKIDHLIYRMGDAHIHSLAYQYFSNDEVNKALYGEKSTSSVKNDI